MNDQPDRRPDAEPVAFDEAHADVDPIRQFARWWNDAVAAVTLDVSAMALVTVGAEQRPDARIVLLKGFDVDGFVFYTNYESDKGRELEANPGACLLFSWSELAREVRIEGRAERTSAAQSDEYFRSRPLGSRIGAWASPQSRPIRSRGWLLRRAAQLALRHGLNPSRPPFWGGYRVRPAAIEFCQRRPSGLHDRLLYTHSGTGWTRSRLVP